MNRLKFYFIFYLIFFACANSYAKTAVQTKNSHVIRIAIAMPISGTYAFFGKQFVNGMILSLNKSGERGASRVRFITVNLPITAGKTVIGGLFKSLRKKDVSAIIGPLFEGQLKYFVKYSNKFKIPVITPSPIITKNESSNYVFSYGMTLKQEIKTEMKYAEEQGIKFVSVIYPDYGYGSLIFKYIKIYSKKYGISLSGSTAYGENTVDFFNNFQNIVVFNGASNVHVSAAEKAELGVTKYDLMHGITETRPNIPFDGLFVIGGNSKLKLILTQLTYYNINGFPIFGLSSLDSRSFMEKNGFYMENSFFPDGFFKHAHNAIVKKFSSAYKNSYGKTPNILSAEGFDIGKIVIKASALESNAVGSSQSNQNAPKGESFYKAISKIKKIKGVCGVINLKNNIFHKSLYLFNYKNGKIYILKNPLE